MEKLPQEFPISSNSFFAFISLAKNRGDGDHNDKKKKKGHRHETGENRRIKIVSVVFQSVFTHFISFNPHSLVQQTLVELLSCVRHCPSTGATSVSETQAVPPPPPPPCSIWACGEQTA